MLALIDTRITKLSEVHEQIHIYWVITAQNTNIGMIPKTPISKDILILQEDGRWFMVKDELGLISREHTLYFKPTVDQMH
jgi:hypothetical protein